MSPEVTHGRRKSFTSVTSQGCAYSATAVDGDVGPALDMGSMEKEVVGLEFAVAIDRANERSSERAMHGCL
jgi:hypothetical protein